MNDHEASTSGTKNEIELTQFPHTHFENDSDSDEDFDRYSYVYEIDENAEGQYISSSPSNISVRTPPVDVPPAQIIPPHNPYSFRHIFFIVCICLFISSALFLSTYIYIKLTSHKVVLKPSTANIISFNTNDSHGPINITYSYTFYNPNSELNLDVCDGTVALYFGLSSHLTTSFSDVSLLPHQQKIVDFNFSTKNPNFRLDSYTEHLLTTNRYYFKLTVKIRMRIYFVYFPLSFYSSKVYTCHFIVSGHPPTGSVPVKNIICE
ncbi:hypothetical protein DCAR_0933278 [Daucus carota subsp. sativus]|uniref:Uncharacterized protein n=1 Tax=Daucus carota subsp. sativus TaxID=79200 RepID=A0A175YD23_DAUCS|nr:hypothetical protein DCAR_0933278 [Daucus carota subsp. sativus]